VSVDDATVGLDLAEQVALLHEQRERDRELIGQLIEVIGRLQTEVREQRVAIGQVADSVPERANEAVGYVRERLGQIERQIEDHVESQDRTEQVAASLREKELRQVGEIAQQVEHLERASEASNGRMLALAEEIRREREGRPPLVHAMDELQRGQTALQSRIVVLDEITKRYTSFQSTVEQGIEQRRDEIARVENQLKLLDLRLSRELAEFRGGVEEWVGVASDQLKGIGVLNRHVGALADQRDSINQRLNELGQQDDRLAGEISRLEAQVKQDGLAYGRLAEASETLSRRLDAAGATSYQLGERIGTLSGEIEEVRVMARDVTQRLDELGRRFGWADGERQRLETGMSTIENVLRTEERELRERVESLQRHVDVAVATLVAQFETRQRVTVDHLRRMVGELQIQLRELEGGSG
jgi:chromosome segregation ATPase